MCDLYEQLMEIREVKKKLEPELTSKKNLISI